MNYFIRGCVLNYGKSGVAAIFRARLLGAPRIDNEITATLMSQFDSLLHDPCIHDLFFAF